MNNAISNPFPNPLLSSFISYINGPGKIHTQGNDEARLALHTHF